MVPNYFTDGGISVVAELYQWKAAQWQDVADTLAKLTAIGQYGMSQIGLFSHDTYIPPDFFCRQLNGWACFYVAKPLPTGDALVYALLCCPVSSANSAAVQAEAARRRAVTQLLAGDYVKPDWAASAPGS